MKRYQFKLWLKRNIVYPIIKVALFFYPPYCRWHEGGIAVDWEECPPACPECGKLLDSKICKRCGGDYLDFNGRFGDDIMGSPAVTSSGDLMCHSCMVRYEREEEEAENEDADYEDYPPEAYAEYENPELLAPNQ